MTSLQEDKSSKRTLNLINNDNRYVINQNMKTTISGD